MMNDRLISAEKLLAKYQELCEGLACIDCPFFGLDNKCGLESMILQEQTVDAVEVVYCKDCKWFDDCECRLEEDVQGIRRTVALKDYCSFGVRK